MKKTKKKRMTKASILFIVIISLFIFIGYTIRGEKNILSDNDKLENLGYSKEEIELINSDEDYLEYTLNHEYDSLYIALIKEKYFLKTRLDRYINYANLHNDLNPKTVISYVNCNLDFDYYTNIEKTDTNQGILLIANKYYKLDQEFSLDLVTMEDRYTRVKGAKLNKDAYEAFKKLSDDAKKENLSILNQSAYRSYSTQERLYNNYVNEHGNDWADKWSARPGHSEHQTGLALDVLTKSNKTLDDFESTKEFAWMQENAYKYGFILRYPENGILRTGYGYEPWHYRYVGKDIAKQIYEENITYEEYYTFYILKK